MGHKGFEVRDLKEEHEGAATSALDERALVAGRADARPAFSNPTPIVDALPDPETWKAVLALDPDAWRDGEGPTGGGWHLSDRYGRAWLRDRDAARWVEQQCKLDEQGGQEQGTAL